MPNDPVLDEPASSRVVERPVPVPGMALDASAFERCAPPVELRPSQVHALAGLDAAPGGSAYVVLPPGTGKTVVGLEAVRRRGRRALVLVPSTAVQAQWLGAWAGFGGAGAHPVPAGTSADLRAAVTVLTYQALSAWDRSADDQDVEDSTDGALAERRRAAVRGIDGADLLSLLHPKGRSLVDRAAALGPWTLVVDECAHLLDTWGSLVPALAAALGDDTVVVGLTATPAEELDERARTVHDRLFPGPDVEVALPDAVVRGEVALVRDLLHVTRPTPEEDALLAGDRGRFGELRDELLRARAGSLPLAPWLERRLHERPSDAGRLSWRALERAEPALARAGLRLAVAGVLELPPGAVLREEHRAPADAEDWGVLLGAYAEEQLRPSTAPEDARLLAAVTRVLPSLGWTLTSRGLRATTSAFDRVCAGSAAKAAGARRVLAQELGVRRTDLRALVVCGFDSRSSDGPARRDAAGPAPGSAGAVFVELATSEVGAALRPVLCTGRTLALRRDDLAALRAFAPHRLADRLVAEPYAGQRSLVRLSAGAAWTAASWVPLVRDWLAAGGTTAVVGTRGLLGEGWDVPCLNVVVDLTATGSPAVATAVRGRVLRRDPARPEEVVHAWTVTCVADEHPRGGVDHLRAVAAARRRLGLTDDGLVEAGTGPLDAALSPDAAPEPVVREAVTARALERAAAHGSTRQGWAAQGRGPGRTAAVLRVRTGRPLGMPAGVVPASLLQVTRTLGSPAPAPLPRTPRRVRLWPLPVAAGVVASASGTALESAVVGAGSGLATGVVLGGAVAGQRWVSQSRALRRAPAQATTAVLRQLGQVVADALHAVGDAPAGAEVRAAERPDGEVELRLDAPPEAAALFVTCLEELLLPLGEPRWLVSRLVLPPPDGPAGARRLAAARAVGRPVEAAVTWHAVPGWLARSRAGVDAFDTAWQRHLGAGRLVLATDPEGRSLVELLRGEDPFAITTRVRTVWSGA